MSKGVGGHQRPYRGHSDVWLTPPEIVAALGPFDLDPCSLPDRPWPTAAVHLTEAEDGLAADWTNQRIWMNSPYGPSTGKWLSRLADHGDGIALVFARTETADFHRYVWSRADGLLFLKGRLHFHHPNGKRASFNAGAPSVLVAYGARNVEALERSGIEGHLVRIEREEDR